ncbi:hypothetical protein Tco_0744923 [Tanacetum coccineum]
MIPLSRRSFDVLVGMDRLSKRKFGIVCHGKVVRIPLEGDSYVGVMVQRTTRSRENRMITLVSVNLIGVVLNVKEEHGVHLKLELELLRKEKLYAKERYWPTPSETSKVENAPAEMLRDLDQEMEKRADDGYTLWIKLYSKYEYEIRYHPDNSKEWNSGDDQLRLRWMIYLVVLADAAESVRDSIGFEYCLASSSGWTKSPVLWAEIGETSLTGLELVLETTDKVEVAEELSSVHYTFHVSNLKKCLADANLHVPLDEIKVDKILRFVEEPVEIMDQEIKKLKRKKIALVKVRWNSKRGPEFTWENKFVDRVFEPAS